MTTHDDEAIRSRMVEQSRQRLFDRLAELQRTLGLTHRLAHERLEAKVDTAFEEYRAAMDSALAEWERSTIQAISQSENYKVLFGL
jgi:hypothetical protein